MSDYSGAEIIGRRFHGCRRKGYDTIEVDRFLEEIAAYVDEIRARLDDSETTEFTAMAMLRGARQAADELLMGSALAANNAEEQVHKQLKQAEDEARRIVAGAQEIAASVVERAQSEADMTRQQRERDVAVLDEAIEERRAELASMTDSVTRLIHASIDQLRESATSVTVTADRLQVEVLAKMDAVTLDADADAI